MNQENPGAWLALMIGNSHLHWAWFDHSTLQRTWDTPHLSAEAVACLIKHRFDFNRCFPPAKGLPIASQEMATIGDRENAVIDASLPLWIASVVPAQAQLWAHQAELNPIKTHQLTLDQIPLRHLYPTFGIDRALALWGAATVYGLPVLVIDAGTALTFSGADANAHLVGGAILPGLGLQLRSLAQHTAALPTLNNHLDALNRSLSSIPRWATNTPDAMISGVVYTLIAGLRDFVQDWRKAYPTSAIVLTGGDSQLLFHYWQQQEPKISSIASVDRQLVFWGMQAIVARQEA